MIVSPGVSLLAAGVASGVCLLLLGLRSRKNSKAKEAKHKDVVVDDGRCACCLAPFLVGRGVRCSDCGAKSCRKACSRWDTTDNAWRCLFCHQRRSWVRRNEKWFENFGRVANGEEELHRFFGTAKSRVHVAGYAAANAEQIQENQEEVRTVHAVRNFVEKIVDGLVDNVDDTSIDRLYDRPEYDTFLEEHRPPLTAALIRLVTCLQVSLTNKRSTDSPAMAHAALREIVERAVEEARKLPGLNTSEDGEQSREGRAIADHSYEDLLATAILNKVIERLQRERVDGNSNVLHITEPSKTKYTSTESECGIGEDVRSYECNGNRDASIRQNGDHQEPVSYMMEERIEEVTTITSDDEPAENDVLEYGCTRRVPFPEFGMDIVDPAPRELSSPSSDSSSSDRNESFSQIKTKYRTEHTMDLVSPIESWEDNWLFQKKRSARSQPDAVAMLVPSSNTCYKALIGDRDAEDTSDLSECSSTKSDEEFEKELMEIDNVIPRSPRTSECDVENHQVPNDTMQLVEDEVDYVCRRKTKAEEIAAEKVVEDEDDKKGPSESSPTLITGTKEEESKTKEKPTNDTAEHGERTIATAVESSMQKNVKVQLEKSSERSDRGNVADEGEEQRESEYTEHYDTAIQRHLDSLTKVDAYSGESEPADETGELTEKQPEKLEDKLDEEEKSERSEAKVQLISATSKSHVDTTAEEDRLSGPPRPGTIAEREHKKWENAPPIENNPYSEENIRKRSWERRYSRKSADVSGVHYEIKKLNDVQLDVLGPDPPDIKRFGRDYYINQSKVASGERSERARSAMSSSSRPSSSLSQRSSCAGDEQRERQDEVMSGETDDVSMSREEHARTMSTWRRNNAEMISFETTNNRAANPRASVDGTDQERRADDILEDQRKNSKNEINAKLNNQEHGLEAERQDEKQGQVRRIDLKAYGFENEFSVARTARPQQQRVVNRLDLRSFGYQDGLRRARSNNQLDQPANNEKSNLTRCVMDREKSRSEYKVFPVDRGDLTKSSGELNQLHEDVVKVGSLVSAKSMPNVADDAYYYANPVRVNNNDDDNDGNNDNDDEKDKFAAKNSLNRVSESDKGVDVRDSTNADGSLNGDDKAPSDLDRSFEDIYIEDKDRLRGPSEKLPMPSVKRLAEAFGGRQPSVTEWVPAKTSKTLVTKLDDVKDRSFTPEVQIVETPKQMHSLTARSLSKEFREGLRQMPSKITSPPVSRSFIEERSANGDRMEIVRSKREDSDIAVISPGKLKSNIKFWEQMQKRN
ncbi:uncharacterized protein LOC116845390 isoform X3 [Odontomachus brunneus]|uniref:uncharacterized protein LOC116845390 isoform X3 n=1 Tax=Odontomachus brunneus TaxID=486640 RepID=UPI0013F187F2|nr:uncharacterized protein LOC116845390 isoform X3 [Odontomachus brunneus]